MLRHNILRTIRSTPARSVRFASIISDQSANIGDYPTDIPAINRQTRSETVKYDDQQGRRNFGEPLHEEDEVLGVFSPDVHTHVPAKTAFLHLGIFVASLLALVGAVKMTYTPLQANRRTYPYNGLEKELGGLPART